MTGKERREQIQELLKNSEEALTGASLAAKFHVTRQIIVKDVAILKAQGFQVLSTAKGYLLQKHFDNRKRRWITVNHDNSEIEKELQIIVDLGGKVLTTEVNHPVYGKLGEGLNIKSRKDISLFLKKIQETGCEPLLKLTKGEHIHLLEAEDEETLNEICEALKQAGYLKN